MINDYQPEPQTGETSMFCGKREVAKHLGCCLRSVDNYMQRGCPYYKLGHRQVRFDLGEVQAWVKREYGCSRIGREDGR